ncbi:unnamed protein product [Paramecium sonneborni]|uniref:Uncharacterized protein n=1 Tax=Paramecium sonneborni TaxID=65129 RepID=A0A8S1LAS5_9CILI|nr:unnamed protein product [Paramecium sonneborni]
MDVQIFNQNQISNLGLKLKIQILQKIWEAKESEFQKSLQQFEKQRQFLILLMKKEEDYNRAQAGGEIYLADDSNLNKENIIYSTIIYNVAEVYGITNSFINK